MPLFPTDTLSEFGGPDAAARMAFTRESGTRTLILGFFAMVVVGLAVSKVRDIVLLRQHNPPLIAAIGGLTVVGTLDSRGDYDHNMFRILQADLTVRAELTDHGWRSIFDSHYGRIFGSISETAFKAAQETNDDASYAILEPFLRAGVAHLMGNADWKGYATAQTSVTVPSPKPGLPAISTTLGALIRQYAHSDNADLSSNSGSASALDTDDAGVDEKQSGGRDVEHGLAIPPDTLARTCPVVLTGSCFDGASVEVQPATVFGPAIYMINLNLTRTGRSRFYQWSRRHVDENLVFVLGHRVVAAGRIGETMDVNDWTIGPLRDGEAAKMLVDYVNNEHKSK